MTNHSKCQYLLQLNVGIVRLIIVSCPVANLSCTTCWKNNRQVINVWYNSFYYSCFIPRIMIPFSFMFESSRYQAFDTVIIYSFLDPVTSRSDMPFSSRRLNLPIRHSFVKLVTQWSYIPFWILWPRDLTCLCGVGDSTYRSGIPLSSLWHSDHILLSGSCDLAIWHAFIESATKRSNICLSSLWFSVPAYICRFCILAILWRACDPGILHSMANLWSTCIPYPTLIFYPVAWKSFTDTLAILNSSDFIATF